MVSITGTNVFAMFNHCKRAAIVSLSIRTPPSVNSSSASVQLLLAVKRRIIFHGPIISDYLEPTLVNHAASFGRLPLLFFQITYFLLGTGKLQNNNS
jgi:hypothetical protein